MPHFNIEYSTNLHGKIDLAALARLMMETSAESGMFERGAIRVRAFSTSTYVIADDAPENAFVDMEFRIGAGREETKKRALGEALFAAATAFFEPLFETPFFALSLEIREIDPDLSWKRNTIHSRMRAG